MAISKRFFPKVSNFDLQRGRQGGQSGGLRPSYNPALSRAESCARDVCVLAFAMASLCVCGCKCAHAQRGPGITALFQFSF